MEALAQAGVLHTLSVTVTKWCAGQLCLETLKVGFIGHLVMAFCKLWMRLCISDIVVQIAGLITHILPAFIAACRLSYRPLGQQARLDTTSTPPGQHLVSSTWRWPSSHRKAQCLGSMLLLSWLSCHAFCHYCLPAALHPKDSTSKAFLLSGCSPMHLAPVTRQACRSDCVYSVVIFCVFGW